MEDTTTNQSFETLKGISSELIEKYNVAGPYYTSYPTLGSWSEDFKSDDFKAALENLCKHKDTPLYLYIHFPFCDKMCFYCSCNSIITKDRKAMREYVMHLIGELDILEKFFKKYFLVVE